MKNPVIFFQGLSLKVTAIDTSQLRPERVKRGQIRFALQILSGLSRTGKPVGNKVNDLLPLTAALGQHLPLVHLGVSRLDNVGQRSGHVAFGLFIARQKNCRLPAEHSRKYLFPDCFLSCLIALPSPQVGYGPDHYTPAGESKKLLQPVPDAFELPAGIQHIQCIEKPARRRRPADPHHITQLRGKHIIDKGTAAHRHKRGTVNIFFADSLQLALLQTSLADALLNLTDRLIYGGIRHKDLLQNIHQYALIFPEQFLVLGKNLHWGRNCRAGVLHWPDILPCHFLSVVAQVKIQGIQQDIAVGTLGIKFLQRFMHDGGVPHCELCQRFHLIGENKTAGGIVLTMAIAIHIEMLRIDG